MKNYQLNILKTFIIEEIKLQKKNKFFLYEDVASTVASADTSAAGKLGIPVFNLTKKSTNGYEAVINNIAGYKFINIEGYNTLRDIGHVFNLVDIISNDATKNNLINFIYTLEIAIYDKVTGGYDTTVGGNNYKKILNSINFDIKYNNDPKNPTITLIAKGMELLNEILKLNTYYAKANDGIAKYEVVEKLEIQLPKSIKLIKS
jgi:hypothetical protein